MRVRYVARPVYRILNYEEPDIRSAQSLSFGRAWLGAGPGSD